MERRQLTEEEKEIVLKKHGKICFVTGHPIDNDKDIEFHHIKSYTLGGPTTIDNIAPVCKEHHKRIGTLSLLEFRDKLELESFFDSAEPKKLDDVLVAKVKTYGQKINYKINSDNSEIVITFFDGRTATFPLYTCPATNCKFFYALIPATNIKNDIELQPRPLDPKRMWELYYHLRNNTVLAASVCRLVNNQILLFDGQHKAAAQIWLGRKYIECKVYIEPDARKLKETNLAAHETLRQMPFYSRILMKKYSDVFHQDWDEYLELPGEKSEEGFVNFLVDSKGQKKAEAIKKIRYALINDIIESQDPKNKITEFIAEKNRARKNPLTLSLLGKTFFKEFLMQPPLNVEFESSDDFRKQEKLNIINLLNIIAEETLIGRWDPASGNAAHKKAERIYLSGAIRAWTPLLKDVIAQVLRLFDREEKEKIFFREIEKDDFERIRERVRRLFSHKIWIDPNPDIDRTLKINEPQITKEFLKKYGLDVGWVLGVEF
jgi:hypothetical protein